MRKSTAITGSSSDLLNSMLSAAMENSSSSDFVLQRPDPKSRYYLRCQIFFFDEPRYLFIEIGYNELTRDVIKHIMTLYRTNQELQSSKPLEYPDSPERYCLYFIDDDESEHAPDYDMGPRSVDEPIGEFPTLAFILNKNFKKQSSQQGEDATMNQEYV